MCFLENFFERKMDLEVGPGTREVASAVVVGGVGGCVFVFVFDKVKVPPYNKEGGGGDGVLEGGELDGPGREAGRVQVEVEGCESVGAVLGEELYSQGIIFEGFWEGDDFMIVKGVYVGGDDNGDSSRCLG